MFMYESAIQLRVLDLFNWVAIFETRLFLKIRNGGFLSQFNYDHGNPKQKISDYFLTQYSFILTIPVFLNVTHSNLNPPLTYYSAAFFP